jgi:hypothetical protein
LRRQGTRTAVSVMGIANKQTLGHRVTLLVD